MYDESIKFSVTYPINDVQMILLLYGVEKDTV